MKITYSTSTYNYNNWLKQGLERSVQLYNFFKFCKPLYSSLQTMSILSQYLTYPNYNTTRKKNLGRNVELSLHSTLTSASIIDF